MYYSPKLMDGCPKHKRPISMQMVLKTWNHMQPGGNGSWRHENESLVKMAENRVLLMGCRKSARRATGMKMAFFGVNG